MKNASLDDCIDVHIRQKKKPKMCESRLKDRTPVCKFHHREMSSVDVTYMFCAAGVVFDRLVCY